MTKPFVSTNGIAIIRMEVRKTIDGLLAFHVYKEYGDGSSLLYLFDFGTGELSCPSDSWASVRDPMNAVGGRPIFAGNCR